MSSDRPRDSQRQRVYDSEKWSGQSPAAVRLLDNGSKVRTTGNVSIEACQEYVDFVCSAAWFQSRWGRKRIKVGHKVYGDATWDGWDISVPPWARSEDVLLHEMAHALTPDRYAAHGPEFVGVMLTLVRYAVSREAAQTYRANLRAKRARVSYAAVPSPGTRTVVPRHKAAAEQRAAARKPLPASRAAEIESLLQRAIKAGQLGAVGSAERKAALATARGLRRIAG